MYARQSAAGWGRFQPSKNPPPLAKDVLAAVAPRLLQSRHRASAFAVAFGFLAYFTAGELVQMKQEDVGFAWDPRRSDVRNPLRAEAIIKEAKTGRDQFVSMPNDAPIDRLKGWLHHRRDLSTNALLFDLSYRQLDR